MRVIFKYRSDGTEKTVTKVTELNAVPSHGELVLAEGRPRQVNRVIWHAMGDAASGAWSLDDAGLPYVEVRLIG